MKTKNFNDQYPDLRYTRNVTNHDISHMTGLKIINLFKSEIYDLRNITLLVKLILLDYPSITQKTRVMKINKPYFKLRAKIDCLLIPGPLFPTTPEFTTYAFKCKLHHTYSHIWRDVIWINCIYVDINENIYNPDTLYIHAIHG
jgi:hypothetical protein